MIDIIKKLEDGSATPASATFTEEHAKLLAAVQAARARNKDTNRNELAAWCEEFRKSKPSDWVTFMNFVFSPDFDALDPFINDAVRRIE